jgi:hypothetical protein
MDMKEVVIRKISKQTEVSKVSESKYYGIEDRGDKAFITQSEYDSNNFILLATEALTLGNAYSTRCTENLEVLLTELINTGFVVYEFDTYKELFKWLSE